MLHRIQLSVIAALLFSVLASISLPASAGYKFVLRGGPNQISDSQCSRFVVQVVGDGQNGNALNQPANIDVNLPLRLTTGGAIIDGETGGLDCSWNNRPVLDAHHWEFEFWARSAIPHDGNNPSQTVRIGAIIDTTATSALQELIEPNADLATLPVISGNAPPGDGGGLAPPLSDDGSSGDGSDSINDMGQGQTTPGNVVFLPDQTFTICQVQTSSETPIAYIQLCEGWTARNCANSGLLGWSLDGAGTNGGTSTHGMALAAMLSGNEVQIAYGGCAGGFDRLAVLKVLR